MKATGIVRRIDDLGRIVIPKELRRTLGINDGDPLEVFVNGKQVVFQKYEPGCNVCGNSGEIEQVLFGTRICRDCVAAIRSIQ